jgi:hypothetical protein
VLKVRMDDFRRRRCEGTRSATRQVRLGLGMEVVWSRRPENPMQPKRDRGLFRAEGAMRMSVLAPPRGCRDTWLLQTCKGAPYEVETRGAACKGGSAVRRHAGGLYDAGSYCYTLAKCLKSFVRNRKGVIEVDDHAQGPPINSEPLVMGRTHSNEKRAPKAPACLLASGLLVVSFFLSLFRDSRSS